MHHEYFNKMMNEQRIKIEVVNSPTILVRVIQTIKRRRININNIFANEQKSSKDGALIEVTIEADSEQTRLLKNQFKKLVDVLKVY